jgi:hypothetical protein
MTQLGTLDSWSTKTNGERFIQFYLNQSAGHSGQPIS